jgi:SAM-dependent methyltransferase
MKLNLGCSDDLRPGYVNVDLGRVIARHRERVDRATVGADLRNAWPWPDSSIEEIRAWDIFEHLPDINHTMNESHRVLRPGGILDLFVPTTDGRGAWQDPGHVSWWNVNTLRYFVECFAEWRRFAAQDGRTAKFRIISRIGPVSGATEWPVPDVEWDDNVAVLDRSPVHIKFPDEVWKLKVLLEAIK